jgi:ribosomal protein L11 methyltransferase
MTDWIAVCITVTPGQAVAAETALDINGSSGIETDGLRLTPGETVAVTGYFEFEPDIDAVRTTFNDLSDGAGDVTISSRRVVNEDWLAEWKKHWRPTPVGRFVIAPPWSDTAGMDGIVIRIEPNMAFGTGTHETTQLCLEAIDGRVNDGTSVLDVGTGTGILAIAAAKLGAAPVYGCDTDAEAVAIAKFNAGSNGVGEICTMRTGEIDRDSPAYDVVLANLTLDVILPILELLIEKARRHLILSGILATQREGIETALEDLGVSRFEVRTKGEWIAVIIEV